jgi:hypothetical protein
MRIVLWLVGGRRKIKAQVSRTRYDSLRCWLFVLFSLRQAARKCAANSVTLGIDVWSLVSWWDIARDDFPRDQGGGSEVEHAMGV